LLGLGASLIGTLLFAVAPDVLWLFAGSVLMGIGVGLTVGTAPAALVDFSAEGQSKRAASVTTAAQAFGFTGVPAQNSETARKPRDYCAAAIPSSA
jgi:MFS family permease